MYQSRTFLFWIKRVCAVGLFLIAIVIACPISTRVFARYSHSLPVAMRCESTASTPERAISTLTAWVKQTTQTLSSRPERERSRSRAIPRSGGTLSLAGPVPQLRVGF